LQCRAGYKPFLELLEERQLLTGGTLFASPINVAVGSTPDSAATLTLDNGSELVLTANFSSNDVSVLQSNGDGTFASLGTLATGGGPNGFAIGEFGNGHQDFAIANYASNSVSVFLGDGAGHFTPAAPLATGSGPANEMAWGDFNGDGKLDLATANQNDGTVSVFLGNGNGTFQPAASYSVGVGCDAIVTGAFRGNGTLDLAVVNYNNSTVTILQNQGNGSFVVGTAIAVGANPWYITAGDFNGDGKDDIATANFGGNNVSVLLSNGDGTFQTPVQYSAGSNPTGVVVGDFNSDGKLDLATSNYGSNDTSVLQGNGDGTFEAAQNYAVGSGPNGLAAADLNGDGKLDLAVADQNSNAVSVLLNIGQTTTATAPTISQQPASQTVTTGQSATFNVTASGTGPLSYQWQKQVSGTWTNLSGATSASFTISSAQAADAGQYRVVVANAAGSATSNTVALTVNGAVVGTGTGLTGQYFNDQTLSNLVLTRTDATVNFNWGGGSPDPSVPADHFSARWTGQVQAQFSETYTFYTESDDGVRLWVNGQLIIDNWTDHAPTENRAAIALLAGQKYDIKMEFYENGGGATAQLLWSSPSTAQQAVPTSQLYVADSTASASFVKTDTTTQGNWASAYGADGYSVSQDANVKVPTYAQLSIIGQSDYTWASSTSDSRALPKPENPGDRIAGTWYTGGGASSFTIDVNLTDGQTHQVALYALDWDSGSRAETIKVLDAGSGSVLDTRSLAAGSFVNGEYLVWTIQGHVKFEVDYNGGYNAVISGLFFGPAAATYTLSASPTSVAPGDTITVNWTAPAGHAAGSGGDWIGMYAVGSSNYPYLAYQWVGSGASGSVTFTAPSAPGSYEFRYFPNDGMILAATSNGVQVQAAKPATPSNLMATAGDGQVALSWSASAGATSYNVYRWNGSAWVVIQNVSGTSTADTGLTNGTTYYYELSAVNSSGESNATNYVIVVPQGAVSITAQPMDSTVSGTSDNLQVSATDSTGGINLVYTWSEISGPAAVTFTTNGTHDASNTIANFSAAGVYQFQVVVSNGVNTATSNPATVTVNQTLTSFTISPASATVNDGSFVIFLPNGLDQFGASATVPYAVWRLSGDGRVVGAGFGIYTAPSIGGGSATITAVGPCGPSTNQATVTYQPSPLAPPTGLAATGANAEVMLTWTASSGATSYNVYRSTASGSEELYQSGITTTSWTDTGLNPNNTRYYYQVQSVNSDGNGTLSSEVSAPLTAPAGPTNLSSTPASGTVSLSWTATAGAGSYNVYYSTSSGTEHLYQGGISSTTWTVTGLTNGTTYYFKVTASNSAGQGGPSAEVSATPSGGNDWFALNIPDVGLQTLARTDLTRDGSITYSDMLGLLNQAIAEGTVTTTILTSLQALVSSSGATYLNMPASVQYLGNALGGSISAGTTATQEQALVNQWFLGAVHPTLDVNTSATGYALAGSSLFGSSGAPLYTDISQGALGDCWLMASLAETAYKAPGIIEASFTDDGLQMANGIQVHVWTLRYFDGSTPKYLTLDNYLPVDGSGFCYAHCNVMWAALYEKAFAVIDGGYANLGGGAAIGALPIIASGTAGNFPFITALADIGQTAYTRAINSSTTLLTVASETTDYGFVAGHDYAVLWCAGSGSSATYQLYNPWGFQQPQAVTWAQITQEGLLLAVDGDEIVRAAPPMSRDPAVAAANMFTQDLGSLVTAIEAPNSASPLVTDTNCSWKTGSVSDGLNNGRENNIAQPTAWQSSTQNKADTFLTLTSLEENLHLADRRISSAYDVSLLDILLDPEPSDYLAGQLSLQGRRVRTASVS
jgi:fibronectin type 3 domain-containing protein